MVDFPPEGTLPTARIAEILAPTLGWEKSSEVVDAAVERLALSRTSLTLEEALSLLAHLARTPGMVGIAARFARSRLDTPRAAPPPASAVLPASGPISVRASASSPRAPTPGTTVTADEVA
jgi:hypothetical protein